MTELAGLPEPSAPLLRWFRVYLRSSFRRHFSAVRLARGGEPPTLDGPLLIVANHPSWWDPVLFMLVSPLLFPGRRDYGPMDAGELDRYRFFRKLGVFGVERQTLAGTRSFLRLGREALSRPRSSLWVTGVGAFHDVRRRPVGLRPGVARLAARVDGVTVLPLAVEYTFWNDRLPEVLLRFGEPLTISGLRRPAPQQWQRILETALEATMDELGRDAEERDPHRFRTLLAGRTGLRGTYRAWRRLRRRRPDASGDRAVESP